MHWCTNSTSEALGSRVMSRKSADDQKCSHATSPLKNVSVMFSGKHYEAITPVTPGCPNKTFRWSFLMVDVGALYSRLNILFDARTKAVPPSDKEY